MFAVARGMRTIVLSFLVAAVSMLELGCEWGCSEAGCYSGVDVVVHGLRSVDPTFFPLRIEACAVMACATFTVEVISNEEVACDPVAIDDGHDAQCEGGFDADVVGVFLFGELDDDVATASVKVTANGGKVLLEGTKVGIPVVENEPNGPHCEPTCTSAAVSFKLANAP